MIESNTTNYQNFEINDNSKVQQLLQFHEKKISQSGSLNEKTNQCAQDNFIKEERSPSPTRRSLNERGHVKNLSTQFENFAESEKNKISIQKKTRTKVNSNFFQPNDSENDENKIRSERINIIEINPQNSMEENIIDKYQKEIQEIPSSEGTYADQIDKFVKIEGFPTNDALYLFLLNPENKAFRRDFLLAAPWIGLTKTSDLLKVMKKRFTSEECSHKEKMVILKFATNLVKRGLCSKKRALHIIKGIDRDNLHQKLQENAQLLQSLATLKKIRPQPLEHHSKEIPFKITYICDDNKKEIINPSSETALKNIVSLIKAMKKRFKSTSCSVGEKKILVEHATRFVKQGFCTKEQAFHILNDEVKNLPEKAQLLKLINALKKAKPQKIRLVKEVSYVIAHDCDLATQFDRIAKNEMQKREKQEFIAEFAKDLATLSFNTLKCLSPTEYSSKDWENEEKAPNIVFKTRLYNQLALFCAKQILSASSKEECARVYSTFIHIAYELVKLNDFDDAHAIFAGLNMFSIDRLNLSVSKYVSTDTKKQWEKLAILGPESNYKMIRDKMKDLRQNQESFVPCIPVLNRDFTFMNDGNKNYLDNKETLNYRKLEDAGELHQQLEDAKPKKIEHGLNYDLITEIYQSDSPKEEELEELSYQILPSKI